MKKIFKEKYLILIIIAVSILVRFLYLKIPLVINPADGAGYVKMANLALIGYWDYFLDDFTYRTPIYPFFIAFIKIIFLDYWDYALAWVQHFMGITMAVLVYFIGKRIFSKTVGFWAGLITGISSYQLYWEHNSMSDFFFSFFVILSFYFFLKALMEDKIKDYVLFGIFFGLNILVRPFFQLFFIAFPFLIYLFVKNFKITMRRFLLVMIPIIIIVFPWIFQHWQRHNYIGILPYLGPNLIQKVQDYIDLDSPLHTEAKKIYYQRMKEMDFDGVGVSGWVEVQRELGLSQVEANKVLEQIGFEAIRRNPSRYVKEAFGEMTILFTRHSTTNFYADPDLDDDFREEYLADLNSKRPLTVFHRRMSLNLTLKIIYFLIPAFLGMLIAVLKKNIKAVLFIVIFFYLLFFISAFEVTTRYRIPLDPFIFLFSSYMIVFTFRKLYKLFLFYSNKK